MIMRQWRGRVPRERCAAIAELEGIEHEAAVEALIDAQVLIAEHKDLRFSHETLRRELAGRLDAAERKRLHRLLGSMLSDHSRGDPEVMLDAGWHLRICEWVIVVVAPLHELLLDQRYGFAELP